jgi:hypothetical protein
VKAEEQLLRPAALVLWYIKRHPRLHTDTGELLHGPRQPGGEGEGKGPDLTVVFDRRDEPDQAKYSTSLRQKKEYNSWFCIFRSIIDKKILIFMILNKYY